MNRMTDDNHDHATPDSENLLQTYYERYRAEAPEQRAAILAAMDSSSINLIPVRPLRTRIVAIVMAVLIIAMGSVLWELRTPHELFGADDLSERLVKVDNFRMTGWQIIPAPLDSGQPDTRLPVEFSVKRPGQFKHTFSGVSENGQTQTIVAGMRLCDGRTETIIQQSLNGYIQVPVQPLDATLKTETIAQGLIFAMILGPPNMQFKPEGTELIKGQKCELFVGSTQKDSSIRLWLNPHTGWPERVVHESINPQGVSTPVMVIDNIEVNGELLDATFVFLPPEGAVDLLAEQRAAIPNLPPDATVVAPALTIDPQGTSSAHSGDQSLIGWNGFQLSDNSALLIWKRTAPTPDDQGQRDWLQGLHLTYQSGETPRDLKHQWVHPPAIDQWLWSIVKTADGRPFERGLILMELRGEQFRLSNAMQALQFPDETLEQLIREAGKGTLPKDAALPTLESLRATAFSLP